jgi:DNA-binding beta-propeller fold protein YncE
MVYGQGKYRFELVEGWAKLPAGESFMDVGGVCTDVQGRVYVLSRSEYPITVFDREGRLVSRWGKGIFARAHGSCIGPDGAIWCTDDRNHTVSKFTPDGNILKTLGTKDSPSDTGYHDAADLFERIASITHGGPPFNRPTGIAFAPAGDIYITDGYGNARVHRFTAEGALVSSWGEPGSGPSQFRLPHHLCVDKSNRVWVVDRENSRIQIFCDDGKFLTQWTDLFRPTGVCIDKEDTVYVSELCMRISVFSMDGELLARWGNDGNMHEDRLFVAPHVITVDDRGDLYVGEVAMTHAKLNRGARTLQKFARLG